MLQLHFSHFHSFWELEILGNPSAASSEAPLGRKGEQSTCRRSDDAVMANLRPEDCVNLEPLLPTSQDLLFRILGNSFFNLHLKWQNNFLMPWKSLLRSQHINFCHSLRSLQFMLPGVCRSLQIF
jgi:hypothetical protein